jgi:hypothetical protein
MSVAAKFAGENTLIRSAPMSWQAFGHAFFKSLTPVRRRWSHVWINSV